MEGAKSNNTPRTPLLSCHVLNGVSENDVGGQAGGLRYSRCCVKKGLHYGPRHYQSRDDYKCPRMVF